MPTINESDLIRGVWLVEPDAHGDARGRFEETYRRSWFPHGREMVQGNRSDKQAGQSRRPPLPPAPGGLLVRAEGPGPGRAARPAPGLADRRRHAVPRDRRSAEIGVFIPPGVAHGFAALTDLTITYLVDQYYNADDELGVAWDDPDIAADWQLTDPVVSERDRVEPAPGRPPAGPHPLLRVADVGVDALGADQPGLHPPAPRRRAAPSAPAARRTRSPGTARGWRRSRPAGPRGRGRGSCASTEPTDAQYGVVKTTHVRSAPAR